MYEHHVWQTQEDTPGLASRAQGALSSECSAGQAETPAAICPLGLPKVP